MVKLILRNKEYEVKPGMTLLSALQKIDVIPESVIATRAGEMILDDEILKDGDVVTIEIEGLGRLINPCLEEQRL